MMNNAGAGTAATGTGAAGMLPLTGGPDSIWFWIVVFVLVSAGFAALRLVPRKTKDDS
ncbi:hypothetical protein [Streptomyces sp. HUAS ZL42]|uniref:hypothetical protein n=1 Tax=Streptomyces sp. HUAS ZL42 TaxID=3231715 RepID=UPI00345E1477